MADSPSEMVLLGPAQKLQVFGAYLRGEAFFPLIGAVLQGAQDGNAWADDAAHPTQVYVEHAFGFAQVCGGHVPGFERSLARYLLEERAFAPAKVRLYTPQLPPFLDVPAAAAWRSERRRFRRPEGAPMEPPSVLPGREVITVTAANFAAVEAAFGVALRFWRSAEDFIAGARATVATVGGQFASICYAAAVSGSQAEIDVLTLPAFRKQGAGLLAVAHFARRCGAEGIEPVWDCFTNNTASVELALACGFQPAAPAYPFFTLPK